MKRTEKVIEIVRLTGPHELVVLVLFLGTLALWGVLIATSF